MSEHDLSTSFHLPLPDLIPLPLEDYPSLDPSVLPDYSLTDSLPLPNYLFPDPLPISGHVTDPQPSSSHYNSQRNRVRDLLRTRSEIGDFHNRFQVLKRDQASFRNEMHMSLSTFKYIVDKVEPLLRKTSTNYTTGPITPEERVYYFMRYILSGDSMRHLSSVVQVSHTTLQSIVNETSRALWTALHPVHMPWPTEERFQEVADLFFHKTGFPHCCGAVDGKHVVIKCPANSGSMFYNYKGKHSIVLQGVADYKTKFITVDVGALGKQHDGGTFEYSKLYKEIERGVLKLPRSSNIPGTNVVAPFVFVADDAYPLRSYIMKPYKGHNLPTDKDRFNRKLASARCAIERAFGIMSQRWRVFKSTIELSPRNADYLILAMCVLHNVIIDYEGIEPEYRNARERGNIRVGPGFNNLNEGTHIREVFTNYFANR